MAPVEAYSALAKLRMSMPAIRISSRGGRVPPAFSTSSQRFMAGGPSCWTSSDIDYLAHGLAGQHLALLPKADLVVAHITSKAGGADVSHAEFRNILDQLLKARCGVFGC
jgi:hypothetical protein